MTKKSKFLKSAALAVAGIALSTSVSSCSMMGEKHNCMSKGDKTKNEKAKCSKNSCSKTKDSKMKCSKKHSCSKSSCGKK